MLIKRIFKALITLTSLLAPAVIYADGLTVHLGSGLGFSKINNTQTLLIHPSTENKYTTSPSTDSFPFMQIGMGYQWNHPTSNFPHVAINMSLSAYLFEHIITGINEPFVNAGSFDTLTYSIQNNVTALLVEPKLIYTAYTWQPYFTLSIGMAMNTLQNYSERPTDANETASAMLYSFQDKTHMNFAYGFGLGVQHPFWKDATDHSLTFALGYHYLNLGKMSLGTYPGQTTGAYLSFDPFKVSLIEMSLIWQY